MRYLYLILVLVVVSSCAHNKIRFVKSHQTHKEVVTEVQDRSTGRTVEVASISEKQSNSESQPERLEPVESAQPQHNNGADFEHEVVDVPASPPLPADTIYTDSDEYKLLQAEEAELAASRSKTLFVTSIVMLLIPFTTFFSIIPFVIGLFLLAKANRSRYITKVGEYATVKAKMARNAYIILLVLFLVLLALLFFLLFW